MEYSFMSKKHVLKRSLVFRVGSSQCFLHPYLHEHTQVRVHSNIHIHSRLQPHTIFYIVAFCCCYWWRWFVLLLLSSNAFVDNIYATIKSNKHTHVYTSYIRIKMFWNRHHKKAMRNVHPFKCSVWLMFSVANCFHSHEHLS